MTKICSCGKQIPQKRIELGFNFCVDCSTVEKYGCVDIVYHKTGNTIEVMEAKDAEKISKLAKRKGFGSMSSLRGGSGGSPSKVSSVSAHVRYIPGKDEFEKAGEKAMKIYEVSGISEAFDFLDDKLRQGEITELHNKNLKTILESFEKPQADSPKTTYWKPESKEPKPEVDPEISEAMKNWRKF